MSVGSDIPPDAYSNTVDVYEKRAEEWQTERTSRADSLAGFAKTLREGVATESADSELTSPLPNGAVLDLGCGPGWHLSQLPAHTVAMDAAAAMLDLVGARSTGSPRIQADLRALPFATGSVRAAWANKCYVHLARTDVPFALWDLHRAIAPGGIAHLGLFGGEEEHGPFAGDDFAGRSFSLWPESQLSDVLLGAGFRVIDRFVSEPLIGKAPFISVTLRRERTLADTVSSGMRLLLVGLNPSLHAADSGVGFSGPTNRGWPAMHESGLDPDGDRDPALMLRTQGIGMTDLVKRATRAASELKRSEYSDGVGRLDRLCEWLRPAAICVIGLTGWRAAGNDEAIAGLQDQTLGGRPVYLMPNPSGLNAHVSKSELADHFRAAAQLADRA